jgi:hypothetical protein
MESALQARQVRPLNEVNGSPLCALELLPATSPPSPKYNAIPGYFTARLSGLDPRLLVSGAACLTVEGMVSTSGWPTISPLSLSVYPIVHANGAEFRGEPDPYANDLQIKPVLRADYGIVNAYGFSIQPSVEEYDLVLALAYPDFEIFSFTRILIHITASMGIHPAAHVPDALALFDRVQLSSLEGHQLFKHCLPPTLPG